MSSKIFFHISDNEEIYREFKAAGFQGIFVECFKDCSDKVYTGRGEIQFNTQEQGRVELTSFSSEDQFLVFTQNFLPGWEASIDGQKVPIAKVNTVFAGIFVPAGQHNIDFSYNYWNLLTPKLILAK